MKKMTVLASLALAVTIGGVYAAWNYAEEGVTAAYATGTIGITGVEGKTTKGTLSAVGANVAVKIDDDTTDTKKHTTVFSYDKAGTFTITFTPNSNATKDVIDNGIDLQWYMGLADLGNQAVDESEVTFDWDYDGDGDCNDTVNINGKEIAESRAIFSITKTPVKIEKADLKKQTNGTFTYTISMEDVMKKISLTEIVLETEAMHTKYSQVVGAHLFHFHVGEYVEPTQP